MCESNRNFKRSNKVTNGLNINYDPITIDFINKASLMYDHLKINLHSTIYNETFMYLRYAYYNSGLDENILKKMKHLGKEKMDSIGCHYKFEKGKYHCNCDVYLISNFKGMSPAFSSSLHCNICGKNPLLCNHIVGELYDDVQCIKTNKCNICLEKECEHIENRYYNNVTTVRIPKDLSFDHISFVEKPDDPSLGVVSVELSKRYVRYRLRLENIDYGKELSCFYCISSIIR